MRIGVLILPASPWRESARWWQMADELGFAHGWTHDHLAWRDLIDDTWFAAIPTLVAAATVTSTIRLGTLVCTPNFRHPVTLAKEAVALDDISDGRMTLGLGAGVDGLDAEVLGDLPIARTARVERFAEFTALTDRLLRHDVTDFEGSHFRVRQARMYPGCRQRPRMPLAIAAASPHTIAIAAQYADIWITNGVSTANTRAAVAKPGNVRAQADLLDAACLRIGRNPQELARLVFHGNRERSALSSVEEFIDIVMGYAEVGVTDLVVPFPRTQPPHMASLAVLERIAADVLPRVQGSVK